MSIIFAPTPASTLLPVLPTLYTPCPLPSARIAFGQFLNRFPHPNRYPAGHAEPAWPREACRPSGV